MNQQAAHSHEDKLLDFAYGELPEAEARTVEAHLAGCARCAGSLESIRGVRKTMSMLETDEAPDVGLESLMAYAQQTARRVQAGPPSRSSPWRKWMFGMAAAASLVVVGIVGTEVSKEVSPQAVIQEKARVQGMAAEQTAADAQPQPEPVPAPAGVASGAAGNELAERATRVTPKLPSLGGSVASRKEEKTQQGGELDVGRMGELARRDAARGGVLGGLNDDQDVAQARNLGMGMGTGRDKLPAAKPGPVPEQPPPPPQRAPSKSDTRNYYDPRTPQPSKDSEQKAVAPSRLSMGGKGSGSGAAPAMPSADAPQDSDQQDSNQKVVAAAEDDPEEESSAYSEGALTSAPAESMPQAVVVREQSASSAAPSPPMAPAATRSSPVPSKKKVASMGTDEYEKLAAQARRSGDLKEEIRYLWEAVARTSPGGRQIGLLSRLCELEISAEMYQPQSCHRLVSEYPRHNAGLLAKKRLEAQAQQMQRK